MLTRQITLARASFFIAILASCLVALTMLVALPDFGALASLAFLTIFGFLTFCFLSLRNEVRRSQQENARGQRDQTRHIEVLFSLFNTLEPQAPLPWFGGWAASPDFVKEVVDVILTERPNVILEAGSGVSTLMVAYCLKKLGSGHVISLEDSEEYAEKTRSSINRHGLTSFATVYTAPLRKYELKAETWKWYDIDGVDMPGKIDLVIIDGPPAQTQRLARYPAFPIIRELLAPEATVILDDGNRPGEREAVKRWASIEPNLKCNYLSLEKGAFVCRLASTSE